MKKLFNKPDFILNIIIVLFEIRGFYIIFNKIGCKIFEYYTQDSNLILLVTSVIYLISMTRGKGKVSRGAALCNYIAACLVSVTFLVVVFCFIPMYGSYFFVGIFNMLFSGANLYHHLLCPVLAVVSFLVAQRDFVPGGKESCLAAIPTFVYAIVLIILNACYIVSGPYPFLYVNDQPVWASVTWFIVIVGGAWGVAALIGFISRKIYISRQKQFNGMVPRMCHTDERFMYIEAEIDELNHVNPQASNEQWNRYNALFWKIYDQLLEMEGNNELMIMSGDKPIAYLRTMLENDGPEYSCMISFCHRSNPANQYEIGACVRGLPIARKKK